MTLLILALIVALNWWAQRDAYRQGIEMGELRERRRWILRQLAERGEHLQLVEREPREQGTIPPCA